MAKRVAPFDPFEGPDVDRDRELGKRTRLEHSTPDIQALQVKSPPPLPPTPPHIQESRRRDARKAEIVRRCAELDPPLTLLELELMKSFKASIQIAKDFTANDWQFLLPRLLEELPKIQSTIQQNEAVIKSIRTDKSSEDDTIYNDISSSAPIRSPTTPSQGKQIRDAAWTENQKPTRDFLENAVRAYISSEWDNGRAINYYNAPRFGAQALVHARDQYQKQQQFMPATARSKLVLDDMKWLYDTIVKPYTENHRKDIFDCRLCDFGSKPLEACIQHFAHKHTNSFSVGSSGIAWCEAEWPKDPPFNPNPQQFPAQQYQHPLTPTQYNPGYYPPPQSTPTPNQYPQYGYRQGATYPSPSYSASPVQSTMPGLSPYVSASPIQSSPFPPQGSPVQQPGWPVPSARMTSSSPVTVNNVYETQFPMPRQMTAPPVVANVHGIAPNFQDHSTDELGAIISHAWMLLSRLGAIGLDDSIVVYAVMHHGLSEFFKRYKIFPPLDMFMASLDRSTKLLSFKRKDKIACKACTKRPNEGSHAPEPQISRKLYNITSLLQHFKNVHQEPKKQFRADPARKDDEDLISVDWKIDMIDLPDPSQIARFANEHEFGQPQLDIFLDAFPDALSHYIQRHARSENTQYDPRIPAIINLSDSIYKDSTHSQPNRHTHRTSSAAADQFLSDLEMNEESRRISANFIQYPERSLPGRSDSSQQYQQLYSRQKQANLEAADATLLQFQPPTGGPGRAAGRWTGNRNNGHDLPKTWNPQNPRGWRGHQ